MDRSPRAVATLLLLVLAAGRMMGLVCEFSCLNASKPHAVDSASAAVRPPTEHCHDSAAPSSVNAVRLVARSQHDGCGHRDLPAPSILTSKSQFKATLHLGEIAPVTWTAFAASNVSAQQLREHTPPGLNPAPIVRLRI